MIFDDVYTTVNSLNRRNTDGENKLRELYVLLRTEPGDLYDIVPLVMKNQETLEELMLKQCSRANDLTRERIVIFDKVK